MESIADILVGIVAALHVGFLVLEMFLWETNLVQTELEPLNHKLDQKGLGITAKLAANMGLYNGFLAAGLIWGLLATQGAFEIKVFFLSCVILAGLFGGFTVKRSILFFQAFPGLPALICHG